MANIKSVLFIIFTFVLVFSACRQAKGPTSEGSSDAENSGGSSSGNSSPSSSGGGSKSVIWVPNSDPTSGPVPTSSFANWTDLDLAIDLPIQDGLTCSFFEIDRDTAYAISLEPGLTQAQDKFIVVGTTTMGLIPFRGCLPNSDLFLARFHQDGSFDASFGPGGQGFVTVNIGDEYDSPVAVHLLPNGSIAVLALVPSVPRSVLALFDSTGNLLQKTNLSLHALTMAIDPVGRILIGGYRFVAGSPGTFATLARYTTCGAPQYLCADGTFNGVWNTGGNISAFAFSQDGDGKIWAVGKSSYHADVGTNYLIAKMENNGTLDPTFGVAGLLEIDFDAGGDSAHFIDTQSTGKLLIAGLSNYSSPYSRKGVGLVRLNRDGTLDNGFGSGGKKLVTAMDSWIRSFALIKQGAHADKLLLAGDEPPPFCKRRIYLTRLNADGEKDLSFGTDGTSVNAMAEEAKYINSAVSEINNHSLAVQRDGKAVIVGAGTWDLDIGLVRFRPNF